MSNQSDFSKSMERIFEKVIADIERVGWSVIYVGTGDEEPAFSYTVGLAANGRPDVFMIGLPSNLSMALLNQCASNLLKKDVDTSDRALVEEVAQTPLAFREDADGLVEGLASVRRRVLQNLNLEDVGFVQLVVPDPNGKFPWDDGCDQSYISLQSPYAFSRSSSAQSDRPH